MDSDRIVPQALAMNLELQKGPGGSCVFIEPGSQDKY